MADGMSDKELRRLSRAELLEMLVAQADLVSSIKNKALVVRWLGGCAA